MNKFVEIKSWLKEVSRIGDKLLDEGTKKKWLLIPKELSS